MVLKYGVNCLNGDEFDFVQILRLYDTGELSVKDLFMPHNAHIMPTNYILALVVGKLTNMNSVAYMLVSQLFAAAAFVIYARYLCKHIDNFFFRIAMIFVIGFIVFNASQWENILWGFQMAWYLIVLCACICSYCLYKIYNDGDKTCYFVLFIVFATISTYSSMHGMLVWLAAWFVIIVLMNTKKLPKKPVVILFLIGITEIIIYFYVYLNYSADKPGEINITDMAGNYLSALGSPVLPMLKEDHSDLAQRFGFIILILSVFVIVHGIVRKNLIKNIFPAFLIVFGHLFALSVLYRPIPLSIRYLTCSFTIIIGLIIFICYYIQEFKNTIPIMLCFSVFISAYVVNNLECVGQLNTVKAQNQNISETFLKTEILDPDKVNSKLTFIMKDRLDFLKDAGYNLFSQTSDQTYTGFKSLYGESEEMDFYAVDTFAIDENMITIVGWAFCPEHYSSFDEMYMVIEDEIFPVSYGIERPDVAEFYSADEVKLSGYNIQCANLFKDEYYANIRLVGIHDGTLYEAKINS